MCDDWFFVVVFEDGFKVYYDRLKNTNCEIPTPDSTVTAACFSENNELLFLGMNNGFMRFINLLEVRVIEDEQEAKEVQLEAREPF